MRNSIDGKAPKDKAAKRNKVIAIGVLSFALIVLTYDVLIGGNIAYMSKWVECGSKPVIVRSGMQFVGFGAQTPSWKVYVNPRPLEEKVGVVTIVESTTHCSAQEAKDAYKYEQGSIQIID